MEQRHYQRLDGISQPTGPRSRLKNPRGRVNAIGGVARQHVQRRYEPARGNGLQKVPIVLRNAASSTKRFSNEGENVCTNHQTPWHALSRKICSSISGATSAAKRAPF